MTAFILAAAALTAAVLVRLLLPLVRSARQRQTLSQQQLNAAVYREHLKELDRDLASGTLSQAHYEEARDELQRRLLHDVAEPVTPAVAEAAAPRRASVATVVVLALAVPLGAAGLYAVLGNHQAIDYVPPDDSPQARTQRAVDELGAALKKPPTTPAEWLRVGRAFAQVGRFNEAVRAFNQASDEVDKDPDLLIELADIMSVAANDNLEGRPLELVERALVLDPQHPMGLMLVGTAAYRRGEPAQAIAQWQKLLAQLEPGSRDHSLVQSYIDQARAEMDKMASAQPAGAAASGVAPVAAAVASAARAEAASGDAAATAVVSGEVTVAPALAAKIGPGDTLFIIARADDGTRMPLAVLRRSASELPMKFTLDDSMAMVPQRTISKAQSLVLVARISKSGQALPQAGDLVSESGAPVKPGATGLRLVIDRQL